MTTNRRLLQITSIVVILTTMLSSFSLPSASAQEGGDGLKREVNAETGKISFISSENTPSLLADRVEDGRPRSDDPAMDLARQYAPEFGVQDPERDLTETDSQELDNGRVTVKYQQKYDGIPIMGGELIVNTNNYGDLYSMNGEVSPNLSLSTQPEIDSNRAQETALQAVAKWNQSSVDQFVVSDPELWIFDESLLKPSDRPVELVWRMEVTSRDNVLPVRELVLVNAHRGGISLHFNQIDEAWGEVHPEKNSKVEVSKPEVTAPRIPISRVSPSSIELIKDPAPHLLGNTWYVATTGDDTNDCATTTTPCATINAAIAKATSDDTILVAEGTYIGSGGTEVVSIDKSITLSGGWNSTFNIQNSPSVIDGQSNLYGIVIDGSNMTVTLSQFIVRNCNTGIFSKNINGISNFSRLALVNNHSYGFYNFFGNVNVENTTISNSKAIAIFNYSGTINIQYSTITNTAGDYAISNQSAYAQFVIGNSILAGNDHDDCRGTITSAGYNIFGSSPPCSNAVTLQLGDQVGVNPQLGPLLSSGYHWLFSGSPAINAANPANCLATDQRGVGRPQGDICDIGAYEVAPSGTFTNLVILNGNNQRTAPGLPFRKYFEVAAIDEMGGPVANVNVIFTAPSSGASGTFSDTGTNTTSTSTNVDGMATSSQFTANNELGNYMLFVSSGGLDDINFDLENGAWYVSPSGNDSNVCNTPVLPCLTINAAISKATNDDTILVAEGTYTGSGTEVVLINKSITLSGGWDGNFSTQTEKSIIDGQEARRGVVINNSGVNVVIDHFLIQNGLVYNNSSGGGIVNGGTLTMLDSEISNNKDGGIYNGGTLTISNSNINSNKDSGIENSGRATVTDSIVHSNIAGATGSSGGGLEGGGIKNHGTMVLNNSSISNNTMLGGFHGSGIYNDGDLTLNSSTVSGNKGAESIYNGWNNLTVNNSTVSKNPNGGIYNANGAVIINNSTISANSVGVTSESYASGTIILENSILANNKSLDCRGWITSNGHNIIGSTSTKCIIQAGGEDLTNVNPLLNSYLSGSPAYHTLFPGSPAIDAANPATCFPVDQLGIARVGTCDIGAVEYTGVTGTTPAHLLFYKGPSKSIAAKNSPIPFSAIVLDTSGNPVPGVHVVFSSPMSGPSGVFNDTGTNSTEAVTNNNGVAISSAFTANTILGNYYVNATTSALSESVDFPTENVLMFVGITTYTGGNLSKLPGTFLCDENEPTCPSGDSHAKKAHQYAIGTYNFYMAKHLRDSMDDNGMTVISTVHYKYNYANAFWDGKQLVFGDAHGFPLADDVVAHEYTHGVTQYESNLYYFYQSGAINESFSDLWGEYYDQSNHLGNDSASVKWLIGEDVTGLGAMRSMKNPPQFGDPDKMSSPNYVKDVSDNGGVHSNSGVNNKAVFLMVNGGNFNGKTITKLGWTKTAAIYYEANTNLLTSASDYSDLYFALQQACSNLIGQKGIASGDCIQVKNALLVVEMNTQPVANFNPEAAFCPTGLATADSLSLYRDDFESGETNWSITGSPKNVWLLKDTYATSPIHMFHGNDELKSNDSSLTMKTRVTVPVDAKAFLHFKHAFLFEHDQVYYDGGVLEYSINNGSTWVDAKPLFSAGQNYKGTIYNSSGSANKLKGRPAFVGDSHGYVSSRYDLISLAGKKVQFRWRMATDQYVSFLGWFVDDVQIYTCIGKPSKPVLSSPANNALVSDYTPDLDWSDSTPAPVTYQIQVADNNAFSAPTYNQKDLSTSDFSVPADLAPNTTYYWRVRAYNALNKPGAWSTVFSFRTVIAPPVLLTPTDGETLATLQPALDWEDVAGATGYTIQASDASDFSNKLVDLNVTSSDYQVLTDLPSATTIYWRVQALGSNGPSDWSTFSFVTP